MRTRRGQLPTVYAGHKTERGKRAYSTGTLLGQRPRVEEICVEYGVDSQEIMAVNQAWQTTENWLRANFPLGLENLGPPASDEQIAAIEALVGPLPGELKEFLGIHNGEQPEEIWLRGIPGTRTDIGIIGKIR